MAASHGTPCLFAVRDCVVIARASPDRRNGRARIDEPPRTAPASRASFLVACSAGPNIGAALLDSWGHPSEDLLFDAVGSVEATRCRTVATH